MTLCAPGCAEDLQEMIPWAINFNGPVSIRYPKDGVSHVSSNNPVPIQPGVAEFVNHSADEQLDGLVIVCGGVLGKAFDGLIDTLKNGSREDIEAVLDVDSFASFYLLNEYLKTFDFDMSSVFFFYKDGKLYAGPAWDYDLTTGNTNINLVNPRAKAVVYTDGLLQNNRNIYKYICDKQWFMDEVRAVYEEHYDYIKSISAEGGLLDRYRSEYQALFDKNYTVWKVSRWWYNYQKPPLATYEENFNYLKNWCSERNEWLSEKFDLFGYEYLRGDADGNGEVEIIDATCIQRILAGLQHDDDGMTAIRAALSGDELDITDATGIQRYLAGLGNPFELDTNVKIKLREL